MHRYFLILGDYALRIPQRTSYRQSIDVLAFADCLRSFDWVPLVTHYEDPGLYQLVRDLRIRWALPATSWAHGYRCLVHSVLPLLELTGLQLIPAVHHVLAYENKVIQACAAAALNLPMPECRGVATREAFERACAELGLPVVVKLPDGFRSSNVQLVNDEQQMHAVADSHFREWQHGNATAGIGSAVVQRYLPGLPGDWKVIIIGNSASCLRREVRPNDFRASGSGRFHFDDPPPALLEFGHRVRLQLFTPWISLDIAEYHNEYFVLEYQCVHFGTRTVDTAPFHFVRTANGSWRRSDGPMNLELQMACAVTRLADSRRT